MALAAHGRIFHPGTPRPDASVVLAKMQSAYEFAIAEKTLSRHLLLPML